jgi:hypothetical protein
MTRMQQTMRCRMARFTVLVRRQPSRQWLGVVYNPFKEAVRQVTGSTRTEVNSKAIAIRNALKAQDFQHVCGNNIELGGV